MLRVEIDGEWGIRDFAGVFYDLDNLAKYFLGQAVAHYTPKIYIVDNVPVWHNEEPDVQSDLIVKGLEFHSPGFFDLAGVGKVCEEIRNLLVWSIEYWSKRNMRKLEEERYSLENMQLGLQISERFGIVDGPSSEHLNGISSSALMRAIAEGRIKSARIIEDKTAD